MGYSIECEYCGANLDPGERCDCRNYEKKGCVKIVKGYKKSENKRPYKRRMA